MGKILLQEFAQRTVSRRKDNGECIENSNVVKI